MQNEPVIAVIFATFLVVFVFMLRNACWSNDQHQHLAKGQDMETRAVLGLSRYALEIGREAQPWVSFAVDREKKERRGAGEGDR